MTIHIISVIQMSGAKSRAAPQNEEHPMRMQDDYIMPKLSHALCIPSLQPESYS